MSSSDAPPFFPHLPPPEGFINDADFEVIGETDYTPHPATATAVPTTHTTVAKGGENDEVGGIKKEEDDGTLLGLFSIRKPVDAEAGISSGLKSAGVGIAAGLGLLVAAPISGYRSEGAKGLLKGIGIGVASAVVLPCTGIGVGLVQAARGVANTPEAIKNRTDETLKWNETTRQWEKHFYALDEEYSKLTADGARPKPKYRAATVSGSTSSNAEAATPSGRKVKSSELYDVLGVPPSATKQEITRAYYKLALKLHPDRNQGEAQEEAKIQFQSVAAAYEVLGNEASRAKYDRDGIVKTSASEVEGEADSPESLLCSAAFINALFSSEDLESFTGELYIASVLEIVGDARGVLDHLATTVRPSGGNFSDHLDGGGDERPKLPENMDELLEFQRNLRSAKLAVQLRRRMQGWSRAPDEAARKMWLEGFRSYFADMCYTEVELTEEERAELAKRIEIEEAKARQMQYPAASSSPSPSAASRNGAEEVILGFFDAVGAVFAGSSASSSSSPSSAQQNSDAPSQATPTPPPPQPQPTKKAEVPTHHKVPNRAKAALLEAVGAAYASRAREFLSAHDALSLTGRVERLKSKARVVGTTGRIAFTALQAFRTFSAAMKKEERRQHLKARKEKEGEKKKEEGEGQGQGKEGQSNDVKGKEKSGDDAAATETAPSPSSSTPTSSTTSTHKTDGGGESSNKKENDSQHGAGKAAEEGDGDGDENDSNEHAVAAMEGGISGVIRACELFNTMDANKAATEAVGKVLGDMAMPREERGDLALGIVQMGLLIQEIADKALDEADAMEEAEEKKKKQLVRQLKEQQKRQRGGDAVPSPAVAGVFGRVQKAVIQAHEAKIEKMRKADEEAHSSEQQTTSQQTPMTSGHSSETHHQTHASSNKANIDETD